MDTITVLVQPIGEICELSVPTTYLRYLLKVMNIFSFCLHDLLNDRLPFGFNLKWRKYKLLLLIYISTLKDNTLGFSYPGSATWRSLVWFRRKMQLAKKFIISLSNSYQFSITFLFTNNGYTKVNLSILTHEVTITEYPLSHHVYYFWFYRNGDQGQILRQNQNIFILVLLGVHGTHYR